MATSHIVGYSKSARAKCHAPSPCKDTPMAVGTLRYGQTIRSEVGETVEWRHWGCVTPNILAELAALPEGRLTGIETLKQDDQNKIKLAISLRRIDPSDIPSSAKVTPSATAQKKRKAGQAGLRQSPQMRAQPTAGSSPNITQEAFEEEIQEEDAREELYCSMVTSVVGIQYYKGLVGPGEEVLLVREPQNKYDRNAIQVKNIARVQVGHLPRNVASKLAPLLDRRLVTVEGVINDGNLKSNGYTLSITLKIYGLADKRPELEPELIWATPGQRGFNTASRTSSKAATATRPPVSAPPPASLPQVNSADVIARAELIRKQKEAVRKEEEALQTAMASQQGKNTSQAIAQAELIRQRREALRKQQEVLRQQQLESARYQQQYQQQEAARRQQEALQKAAELRQILHGLEKIDDESRRGSLLDALCSAEDVLNMPVHENPPGIRTGELTVDLLKHQRQALKWCIERENPILPKAIEDKPVQFWQMREDPKQKYYYNIATKTPTTTPPPLGRGALCADDMGLGKTLTMIALILATKKEIDSGFSNTTLIVAPLSVLSNWEKQLLDHCTSGTVKSCVYYGNNKGLSATELQKFDVVITTYQTVVGEHTDGGNGAGEPIRKKKKVSRTLFEVPWKRVILDEGHNIRNPKTKMARSVVALNASRRWVLTGTPIINSPRDLGSLLTFLKICQPLDNEDFYKRMLLRPLKDGNTSGVELLRALMSHICIRRTKEMQDSAGKSIIELPPVEMIKVPVALSEEARRLYDEVEQVSKQRIENFLNAESKVMVQSNVLSMLTRMRQIALHPGLVPANYLEQLRAAEANDSAEAMARTITPAEKLRLQDVLAQAIEDCEECPICFGVLPNDARITSCAHVFCIACITEIISRDPKCPLDRRALTMNDLHEPPPPTDLTQRPVRDLEEDEPEGIRAGSSAKIDQLVHLLTLTPGTEKSLVFSQFTSFLDKIAEALDEAGIPYVRFDGKMSARRRQEAIAEFSVPLEEESSSSHLHAPKIRRTGQQENDGDDESDFVMDDDSDDFIEEEENESFSRKKAKSNAKNKARKECPRVMLLSLKAGALGLNLTVANNVYLMDPWWQEGIESQAVDRVNRIGQKKPVHVYQLIAEDTVESKVLEIQEKKKQLIQQAFSGIKRTETQRQQREARLQDLVELFGIRRQNSQAA